MANVGHTFDESTAYEQFMGRWSRAAGIVFLNWLAPPANARWLDVGCGTGSFTEAILAFCTPAAVAAIDPSKAQVEHACRQAVAQQASFRLADAQALPFAEATFDVIVSALVMNFIPSPQQALSEMRRVARAGGIIGSYVWDFEAERSPSWPLRAGMRQLGFHAPEVPGTSTSSHAAMRALFDEAKLKDVATITIDATLSFANFDEFWRTQTTPYSPTTKMIEAMTTTERNHLTEVIRDSLSPSPIGRIEYSARANAIKARVPS